MWSQKHMEIRVSETWEQRGNITWITQVPPWWIHPSSKANKKIKAYTIPYILITYGKLLFPSSFPFPTKGPILWPLCLLPLDKAQQTNSDQT